MNKDKRVHLKGEERRRVAALIALKYRENPGITAQDLADQEHGGYRLGYYTILRLLHEEGIGLKGPSLVGAERTQFAKNVAEEYDNTLLSVEEMASRHEVGIAKMYNLLNEGGAFLSPPRANVGRTRNDVAAQYGLTDQEVEIVELVSVGTTTSEILDRLAIAEKALIVNLNEIHDKLGTRNNVQIALKWLGVRR